MPHWRTAGVVVLAAAMCGVIAVGWWRSANIGPVQRGADLALSQGCQGCHGGLGESPQLPRSFSELDVVDSATLREWILDGMPRRVRRIRNSARHSPAPRYRCRRGEHASAAARSTT